MGSHDILDEYSFKEIKVYIQITILILYIFLKYFPQFVMLLLSATMSI